MNTNTLPLFTIALLALSCSRPLTLAFSVPDQMEYQYKSLSITNTTSKVMGMDMESSSIQEFDYTLKDVGKTADGNHKLALKYDYIKAVQAAMGNEIAYDSKAPAEDNDPTTRYIYEAMLNNPFELIYTPEGNIVEAPGIDKMMAVMFEKVPEEIKATFQSQMSEQALLQVFQNINNFYPKTSIKKGSTWNLSQETSMMGMLMNIDMTYTLLDRKDGKANISLEGTIATSPDGAGMEMMGMTMSYNLAGTQSGLMVVEESSGWPIRMNMQQHMSGTISIDNPQTGPMEIDMILDTDLSLDRLK